MNEGSPRPVRRSRSVVADLERAMRLHREGRLDEAEALYRGVLAADPQNFDAQHLLGVIEGQHHRFESALPLLERAVALRPDNAGALNNLGNTYAGLLRYTEAAAAFDRSLALKPANPKALRNRGTALRKLGRLDEALASLDAALALEPDFTDAMVSRAELLQEMHRTTEAIAGFRAALAGGKDVALLRYALASLGAEPVPAHAPPDYVKALFDEYAGTFDQHLVESLKYGAPALVAAAARAALPALPVRDAVDLGCGTGLCGPLLRPLAQRLVGVDLSEAMLERARAGGSYDELDCAELVAWLAARTAAFDLAVAADVLIYLGDFDPVFAALRSALRRGAACVFTVEAAAGSHYTLKPSRRYGHSLAYLRGCADRHGLAVESIASAVLREDAERDIDGHVVVLRAPA